MTPIRHIWFDFSETVVAFDKGVHDALVYETYAKIKGKSVDDALKAEWKELRSKYASYSATFVALGKAADFWSSRINSVDPAVMTSLKDPEAPEIFQKLRALMPISIWSNIETERILEAHGIDPDWFANILGPGEVKNPKPALDGFELLIKRSGLHPEDILFVGDSVEKEILPAKSLGIQAGIIWSDAPEADYRFGSFRDILNLVR